MGKRQPIQVLDKEFQSKTEADLFTKQILNSYQLGQTLTEVDSAFISDLLTRHPEYVKKVGCGIRSFEKRRGGEWNTECFYIIRIDGSETDFSYKQCINNDTSNEQRRDFKKAGRLAVKEQATAYYSAYIKRYRTHEGKVPSEKNGELIRVADAHVDHTPPMTFNKIVTDFIVDRQIELEHIKFIGHDDGETQVEFEDELLRLDFAEYHRTHAVLRMISKQENLTQKKK